jgi:uncharacterized protein YndB with AHSA1/START domain
MLKTGEAYTAARAHIAKSRVPTVAPVDYAALAGMSDEKLKAKTGCTWERWVRALDRDGAERMSHRDIAKLVGTKYKAGPWWTQMITVGYERIKKLRARGQQRNGTFQMSKSRTFDVPVTALFDAWVDPNLRRRWLPGAHVKVRTATAPKSIRFDWDDGAILVVAFAPKGTSKSSVAVEHTKLNNRAMVDGLKAFWSDRLDTLNEMLSGR